MNHVIPNRKRVLVAEDHQMTRDVYQIVFKETGHDFTYVNCGECALAAYVKAREEGRPYDLLLLDGKMGKVGGVEVACAVRREYHDRKTEIVIITSSYEIELPSVLTDIKTIAVPKLVFLDVDRLVGLVNNTPTPANIGGQYEANYFDSESFLTGLPYAPRG
jgi:CheY-like chemotaxis protein